MHGLIGGNIDAWNNGEDIIIMALVRVVGEVMEGLHDVVGVRIVEKPWFFLVDVYETEDGYTLT